AVQRAAPPSPGILQKFLSCHDGCRTPAVSPVTTMSRHQLKPRRSHRYCRAKAPRQILRPLVYSLQLPLDTSFCCFSSVERQYFFYAATDSSTTGIPSDGAKVTPRRTTWTLRPGAARSAPRDNTCASTIFISYKANAAPKQ